MLIAKGPDIGSKNDLTRSPPLALRLFLIPFPLEMLLLIILLPLSSSFVILVHLLLPLDLLLDLLLLPLDNLGLVDGLNLLQNRDGLLVVGLENDCTLLHVCLAGLRFLNLGLRGVRQSGLELARNLERVEATSLSNDGL